MRLGMRCGEGPFEAAPLLEVDDVERVSDLEYLIAVNEPSRCDTLQPNEAVATLWGRGVSAGQPHPGSIRRRGSDAPVPAPCRRLLRCPGAYPASFLAIDAMCLP